MPHELKQKKLTKVFTKNVYSVFLLPFNKTLSAPHYFCSVFAPQELKTQQYPWLGFPLCWIFQDDILTVIRRVDENWAEGMLGDKIGIFPISYVEVRKTFFIDANNSPIITEANTSLGSEKMRRSFEHSPRS